jgi:hypothetical protein
MDHVEGGRVIGESDHARCRGFAPWLANEPTVSVGDRLSGGVSLAESR